MDLRARFAAAHFTPSAPFRALPDFVPFDAAGGRIEAGIHAGLRAPLLLDATGPDWRSQYLSGDMKLE